MKALNQQWGTGFSTWASVIPDDTYEAQQRGNYASWADHRTFMEKSWAEQFKFVRDELKKLDPGGLAQNSGTQVSGAHNGTDYSRMDPYTGQANAYNIGNQFEFHHDFAPDMKVSGGAGYGVLGKDVFYNFYSNLFKGAAAGAYVFWQYSTLRPDLTMYQSGLDMKQGFDELRGAGIGKLIGSAALGNNPDIAIHYSYPSIHGSWIVDGTIKKTVTGETSETFAQFRADRDGWVEILRDTGMQFDFISYTGIEKGGLDDYNVLVLPMSVALSDQEVQEIRSFVRQGGTLIADALPGVMGGHAAFRKERALAKVFGIAPKGFTRAEVTTPDHEPGLTLDGARPLLRKENPLMLLHHRYGDGEAFLLNYFLDGYPDAKREGTNGPALSKMKRVLKTAGMAPEIRLTAPRGGSVSGLAKYVFESGPVRLLGIVPDKQREGGAKPSKST